MAVTARRGNATVRELRESRDVLAELTRREIRGRYRGAVLGQMWGLLNPLAMMVVYTVVFRRILKVVPPVGHPSGVDVFALWIMCGLLPWIFVTNCLSNGLTSLVANAGLVTKVWFPREILVASVTLAWTVSFAFEMAVLTVALVAVGNAAAVLWVFAALPVMLLLLLFATGLALAASVCHVYFRDTAQIVGIGMQVWFYATPIVYPARLVPESLAPVLALNPMKYFVGCFRALLYDGRAPNWHDLAGVCTSAVVSIVAGYWVFRRFEARLAEEL